MDTLLTQQTSLEHAQTLTDSFAGIVAITAVYMTIIMLTMVMLLSIAQAGARYVLSALILTAACALSVVAVGSAYPSLAGSGSGEPGYIALQGPGYWWWFLPISLGAITAAFVFAMRMTKHKKFVVARVLAIVFGVATVASAFVIIFDSERATRPC